MGTEILQAIYALQKYLCRNASMKTCCAASGTNIHAHTYLYITKTALTCTCTYILTGIYLYKHVCMYEFVATIFIEKINNSRFQSDFEARKPFFVIL